MAALDAPVTENPALVRQAEILHGGCDLPAGGRFEPQGTVRFGAGEEALLLVSRMGLLEGFTRGAEGVHVAAFSDELLTVAESNASLKTAVKGVLILIPELPFNGVTDETVGGTRSLGTNTTSTQ